MRLIRNRPQWRDGAFAPGPCVVAIGNFDGVHLGHRALIETSRQLAGPGGSVAVVTFEPLPQTFFRPEHAPARLSTVFQKLDLLRSAGVDMTWLMRFDSQLAVLSAREFVERVLVEKMNASHVVVGEGFDQEEFRAVFNQDGLVVKEGDTLTDGTTTVVLDPDTGEIREITGPEDFNQVVLSPDNTRAYFTEVTLEGHMVRAEFYIRQVLRDYR